jgi:hypothetical protein
MWRCRVGGVTYLVHVHVAWRRAHWLPSTNASEIHPDRIPVDDLSSQPTSTTIAISYSNFVNNPLDTKKRKKKNTKPTLPALFRHHYSPITASLFAATHP